MSRVSNPYVLQVEYVLVPLLFMLPAFSLWTCYKFPPFLLLFCFFFTPRTLLTELRPTQPLRLVIVSVLSKFMCVRFFCSMACSHSHIRDAPVA